jgi:hypothetical protein
VACRLAFAQREFELISVAQKLQQNALEARKIRVFIETRDDPAVAQGNACAVKNAREVVAHSNNKGATGTAKALPSAQDDVSGARP